MSKQKEAKHKLVVVGDSLSQGFNNGGIYRTDINFPAFLARCFDPQPAFDQPRFTAQAGIPLNLEVLVRGLSDNYGDEINWSEMIPAAGHMVKTLKRIKNYWEGGLKDLSIDRQAPYHNQSVWGFAINDSWLVNEDNSHTYIKTNRERVTIFDMLPEHAMYTTARLVLNPSFRESSNMNNQLDNARYFKENGGIENLIACLGHNNIIGSVTNLNMTWSEEDDLETFPGLRKCTVYRPGHFEKSYRQLAQRINQLDAKRVFVPTIPYVTIPPVCRGVNSDLSSKRLGYFDYYTRFWIWDEDFDPDKHPHLTKDEAIQLDFTVDEYNDIIRKIADEYGWHVVPMAKNVAGLAERRHGGEIVRDLPQGLAKALRKNPSTAHLVDEDDDVKLTTEFLRLNKEGKIYKGGIFSLDGLHPTTIAYGLIANTYFKTMREAGVRFQQPIDWDYVVSEDTLINNPPPLLAELRTVLRYLAMGHQERFFKFGKNVLAQLLGLMSGREAPEN